MAQKRRNKLDAEEGQSSSLLYEALAQNVFENSNRLLEQRPEAATMCIRVDTER